MGVLVFAALVVAVAGVAAASSVVVLGRVASKYETSKLSLSRDCGFSQPLASGKSLWLFCDTAIYKNMSPGGWTQASLIWGNTAAEGPYAVGQVPTGLSEVPAPPKRITGGASPPAQRFQSNPTSLYIPGSNGRKCPTPLAWPNGVTTVPGSPSLLLITYSEVCNSSGTKTVEGAELVEYNSVTNKVVGGPWEVYKATTSGATLPVPERIGSPVLSTDQTTLYFFSTSCQMVSGVCSSGAVYLARVAASPAAWSSAANYRFWDPTSKTWVSSPASAGPLFNDGGQGAIGVTVNSFPGRGLVLIEHVDLAGGYKVWEQASFAPTGAWTAGPSGSLPNCNGSFHHVGYFCRSMIGHPELSTTTDLLMSYFTPDTINYPPAGHELLVRIPW
jgi:hypothetical protein